MDVQILILNISQNISKYLTEKTVENLDNVDNIDKFVNLDNVDTADSVDTFHITWAQTFFYSNHLLIFVSLFKRERALDKLSFSSIPLNSDFNRI